MKPIFSFVLITLIFIFFQNISYSQDNKLVQYLKAIYQIETMKTKKQISYSDYIKKKKPYEDAISAIIKEKNIKITLKHNV
ncbi:MAG: hypothetical protein AB1782_08900 [Cyanobacteriota bacterium]